MGDPFSFKKATDILEILTADGKIWSDNMPTIDGTHITLEWEGGEPAEVKKGYAANFEEKGLEEVEFEERLAKRCVALLMQDNSFSSLPATGATSMPYLRYLNISSNSIETFPCLDELPNLLVLDLSMNELKPGGGEVMSPHNKLQTLMMDGCSLEAVDPGLAVRCPALKILSVADNEIEKVKAMEAIKGMPALEQLFVADNPLAEKSKHVKELCALQPNLKRVDLQLMGAGPGSVSLGDRTKQMELLKKALSSKDGVLDANKDRSTCSCVEGNACGSKDNCYATVRQLIDLGCAGPEWKKHGKGKLELDTRVNIYAIRDEVAAAARKMKGIAD